MALERVQPVPCVLATAMRSPGSQTEEQSARTSRSSAAPVAWPPLTRTAPDTSVLTRAASLSTSARLLGTPTPPPPAKRAASLTASGMLGVTSVASPKSSPTTASTVSEPESEVPVEDTITGSRTTGTHPPSPAP